MTNDEGRAAANAIIDLLVARGISSAPEIIAITAQLLVSAWSILGGRSDGDGLAHYVKAAYDDTMDNQASGHIPP